MSVDDEDIKGSYEISDLRLNPDLVSSDYNPDKRTISFSANPPKIGGKTARITKRKINKKRNRPGRRVAYI